MTTSPLTFKEIEQMLDTHAEAAVNAHLCGTDLADRHLQTAHDALWAELERVRRVQELCVWALAQVDGGPFPDLEDPTPVPGWVCLIENALDGAEVPA